MTLFLLIVLSVFFEVSYSDNRIEDSEKNTYNCENFNDCNDCITSLDKCYWKLNRGVCTNDYVATERYIQKSAVINSVGFP